MKPIVAEDPDEVEVLEGEDYVAYDEIIKEHTRIVMKEVNRLRRVQHKGKKAKRKQSRSARKRNNG